MWGVTKYVKMDQYDTLKELLYKAIDDPESISLKVDGSPALLIGKNIFGINGTFVAYKTLLGRLAKGDNSRVFTSEDMIDKFASKREKTEHQIKALKYALSVASELNEGTMLWGDTLWAGFDDIETDIDKDIIVFKPNTVEYEMSWKEYGDRDFGIVFHSEVKEDCSIHTLTNPIQEYFGGHNFIDCAVLGPLELKPVTIVKLKDPEELKKQISECLEALEIEKEDEQAMEKLLSIRDTIIDLYSDSPLRPHTGEGEGLVIEDGGRQLKLVKNSFTQENLEHIHSKKLTERIVSGGDKVKAWTSSKSNNLFDYYFNDTLRFGVSGGSMYGAASYFVTEPPFSGKADIGYSDSTRKQLYGDYCYEMDISAQRIVFFNYDEYKQTAKGKESPATPENFVNYQLEELNVDLDSYVGVQPEEGDEFTGKYAITLFKKMSQKYYQGSKGNIRSPVDGFQYKGKSDGNTLVVWNYEALQPVRMTKDGGLTWEDVDPEDPRVKDFLEHRKDAYDYKANEKKRLNKAFGGNWTEEKEKVYRLLMAYNSNDYDEAQMKMAEGLFTEIVINDNKSIDATYTSNMPFTDNFQHYFRAKQHSLFKKITDMSYYFGKINASLRLNGDYVPDYLPEEVTGDLKLAKFTINSESFDIPVKFGRKHLKLENCTIEEDVFDGWDVDLTKAKPTICRDPELKAELADKYEWGQWLLDEIPEKKPRKR